MNCNINTYHKSRLAAAVFAAAMAFSSTSQADENNIQLDIEQQKIDSAIIDLATQANVHIAFPKSLGNNVTLPAIKGRYTLDDALEKMFQGTDLTYEFITDDSIIIKNRNSQSTEQTTDKKEADEEVVVVGTRLKGHNPASPVITLDRDALSKGSYSSIEDVFRRLPQNFSSITSASTELGQVETGEARLLSSLGTSSVNLRGLGSRSTLVLINGKRKASSAVGSGSFTDISSIPLSQVERIEILTDGASAIYGADAVAGVVNIVLRKDYDGLTINYRNEKSFSNADQERFSVGYTASWDSGYLTTSVDASKTSSADMNKFTISGPGGLGDKTHLGGVDSRTYGVGSPGTVYNVGRTFPSGFQLVGDLIDGPEENTNSQFDDRLLGPEVNRKSLRFNGEQELGGEHSLSFDVAATTQKDGRTWHPIYDRLSVTRFTARINPDGSISQFNNLVPIPEDNPHNTYGEDVMVGYSFEQERRAIELSENNKLNTYNGLFGLSGKLPFAEDWDYNLDFSYGREKGAVSSLRFDRFDPETEARLPSVWQSLNVFTDGSDPDVIASNVELLRTLISEDKRWEYESQNYGIEGNIGGTLFSLPAGDVQMVAGFEVREENHQLNSTLEVDSNNSVKVVYAEMGLPLLADLPAIKNLDLTLAARSESFDVDGISQARNSTSVVPVDFSLSELLDGLEFGEGSDFGPPQRDKSSFSHTSPKISLNWQVNDDLRLRASWGESFLAPRASQMYGEKSVSSSRSFIRNIDFSNSSIDRPTEVLRLSGPNSGLQPQEATTLTYGFDYTPYWIDGMTFAATYGKTDFSNYITSPQYGGNSLQEMIDDFESFRGRFFYTSQTADGEDILVYERRRLNVAGRTSRTIDYRISYDLQTESMGSWLFDLNAVQTLEVTQQDSVFLDPREIAGTSNGPSRWVSNFTTSWTYGDYNVTAIVNYSSSYSVVNPLSASFGRIIKDSERALWPNGINPNPQERAEPSTLLDLQVSYQPAAGSGWLEGSRISLGVQNVLNTRPRFVDNEDGFLANRYNPRARVLQLDVQKSFDF
ncbi:TonB-dependent receptor [Porticoccus sp. W117]|uniref:TonB-dependent receptor n=1 Tax=Porticoccus sp. W117 TaxID=3054777 RepID=UPI002598A985|nr:TonB-dependent receptor [Porticoccus sp. W117]MDM3871879.1 TonB-dependent receptor [Porticoccus sp. W117]